MLRNTSNHAGVDVMEVDSQLPPNPLLAMHHLLRGRYSIAIILAIFLGIAGAIAGFFATRVQYQSSGLIGFKPVLPAVLNRDDQGNVMPMFDAFVDSQVTLIQDQRVIDLAIHDVDWQAKKPGMRPNQITDFSKSLEVTHLHGDEIITVSFSDPDPVTARLGAQAVVRAYEQLYGQSDSNQISIRISRLEDLRSKYTAELQDWQTKKLAVADEQGAGAGGEALNQIYKSKLAQLNSLEARLQEAQLDVALFATDDQSATTRPAVDELSTLPLSALAAYSPELDKLLAQRLQMQQNLRVDQQRMGTENPATKSLQTALDATDDQINSIASELRHQLPVSANAVLATGKTFHQLQVQERNIQLLFDRVKAETLAMGRKSTEAAAYQSGADAAQRKLDETNESLEQLNRQSSVGGRVEIDSYGSQPIAPVKDKRKAIAVAGFLAGASLGIGCVLLFGSMNRSVRFISDISVGPATSNPLLGVLPHLPRDLADAEQAIAAAHSVHRIRAMLQHHHVGDGHPVFGITSSSPGAGKTSLTLGLGLSFAASGARVLMIDCDIISGGLTAHIKRVARRRLGQILQREGSVTREQIDSALDTSRRSQKRVGETMVDLGFASTETIESALNLQKKTTVGLREAMEGDDPADCIAATGATGLYVMPLGSAQPRHAGQFSAASLRKIVEHVRQQFDVVIIDTGPVLGSLEASVVAQVADEMVIAVARGENKQLFELAVEAVINAGGHLAGTVLNGADMLDIRLSGLSQYSGLSGNRRGVSPALELQPVTNDFLMLGPIGYAVASATDMAVEVEGDSQ